MKELAEYFIKKAYLLDLIKLMESMHLKQKMSCQVNIGCECKDEEKHGWTTIKCCNECGLSVESFWNKK